MFKRVEIKLNKDNHQYIVLDEGKEIIPKKTISGSMLFKPYQEPLDHLTKCKQDEIKLYGLLATEMGTTIHLLLENIVNHYKLYRDINFLKKLANKYNENNFMFSHTLHNLIDLLGNLEIKDLDTEVMTGLYNGEILLCGSADLKITLSNNNIVLGDYKTMCEPKQDNLFDVVFHSIKNKLLYENIDFDYYLEKNDLGFDKTISFTKKGLNYLYQLGYYSLLFSSQEGYFIPSTNKNIYLDEEDILRLKKIVKLRINKLLGDK